jgi:hypothetical protein
MSAASAVSEYALRFISENPGNTMYLGQEGGQLDVGLLCQRVQHRRQAREQGAQRCHGVRPALACKMSDHTLCSIVCTSHRDPYLLAIVVYKHMSAQQVNRAN